MYRVFLLSLGMMLMVIAEDVDKCDRLMHEGIRCCNREMVDKPDTPETLKDTKECLKLPRNSKTCEIEMCMAKKLGYATPDGIIDKKKFVDDMLKHFTKDDELADLMNDNCLEGDISKYGDKDICDFIKLAKCSEVQLIKSCHDWKDEGVCKGVKDLADECMVNFE